MYFPILAGNSWFYYQCIKPLHEPQLFLRTFVSVSTEQFVEVGSMMSRAQLAKHFPLQISSEPQWLNSRLVYLFEIPKHNSFEGKLTFGRKEGENKEDTVPEDSALAYRSPHGLVIITGCSHSGICNIIEYAKRVCGDSRIVDVTGGFHLLNPSTKHLQGTLAYFRNLKVAKLHACHCTDLRSKIALAAVAEVEEVGVGMRLYFD